MLNQFKGPRDGNSGCDDPNNFNKLPSQIQQMLLDWIDEHLDPTQKKRRGYTPMTSYGMKHHFSHDASLYINNGDFKGTMLAAGLRIDNPAAQNWEVHGCYSRIEGQRGEWGEKWFASHLNKQGQQN